MCLDSRLSYKTHVELFAKTLKKQLDSYSEINQSLQNHVNQEEWFVLFSQWWGMKSSSGGFLSSSEAKEVSRSYCWFVSNVLKFSLL